MVIAANPALLRELTELLHAGGIPDAELEAKWILEDAETEAQAMHIAEHRAKHEPLQYLLGKWEFYGLPVYVGQGVLIPRADTETLVETVLSRIPKKSSLHIADLCTGSGCIALALAAQLKQAELTGIERSAEAFAYAEKNRRLNGLQNVNLICADVLEPQTAAQFSLLDAIVCNPPYLTAAEMTQLQEEVQYEPAEALCGGEDGLDFYRSITQLWKDKLCAGGLLAYEVGFSQADAVAELLAENGFSGIEKCRDLNGIERVVCGIYSL